MHTRTLVWWPSIVAAVLIMLASATAVFAATPAINYSASGSTPGSTLTLSGSGFQPGETVSISFGLANTSATANGAGEFSGATLTVPNVTSGLYYVIAVGQSSGFVAFNSIWINSFFPQASPNSWYIAPGSTLTWSGSGFAPGETIVLRDGAGATLASWSANSSGAFAAVGGSIVPFAARNSVITYTLQGVVSGINLSYGVAVADLYPSGTPTTWYALPGTAVTFSGNGFGPGEVVNLMLGADTTVLGSATTDGTGAFATLGPVNLPFGSLASYKLVGASSGAVASVPITLASFYPSIAPSAYYAAPGSTVSLSGTGFAPNESVTIKVGTDTKGTATTNSLGAFAGFSLALPATPNTLPVVSGTGAQSGTVASFTMAIGDYYSWLNLSTWWAQGGSALTVFGHNFAAGETVTATAGATTLGSIVADSSGDATIVTTVPFVPPGETAIKLTGGTSGAVAQATMTVAPVWTDLQLGSYAVPRGSAVVLIGSGYLPNEPIEVRTDRTGSTVVHTFSAGGGGSFNNSGYIIPADFAEGLMTITVKSLHSFNSKDITFWVGI
jgi:hypothetical protein